MAAGLKHSDPNRSRRFPVDLKLTIREARVFANLNQAALGELVGLHQTIISVIESGLVCVPKAKRPDWAEALGVPLEQLIFLD